MAGEAPGGIRSPSEAADSNPVIKADEVTGTVILASREGVCTGTITGIGST
jgi:hypothetical protein